MPEEYEMTVKEKEVQRALGLLNVYRFKTYISYLTSNSSGTRYTEGNIKVESIDFADAKDRVLAEMEKVYPRAKIRIDQSKMYIYVYRF